MVRKRSTREEMRRRRNNELAVIRVKRYKEKHKIKVFQADLEGELADEITSYLKDIGITKKDFIIESYKRLKKFGSL